MYRFYCVGLSHFLLTFLLVAVPVGYAELPDLLNLPLEDLVNIKVSTASKKSEKVSDAPATVYVITKSDIRYRGYSFLTDVLRDLPGMESIEHYFSEEGTLIPVRGVVGNNKIVVLLNGVRLNPPGGENMMFRRDISIRMAEQIEVIYGPGSTLYGQDAISAVINIVTENRSRPNEAQVLGALGMNQSRQAYGSFSRQLSEDTEDPVVFSGYAHHMRSDLTDLSKKYKQWWKNYQNVIDKTRPGSNMARWDDGTNAMLRLENSRSSIQAWIRDSSRSSAEGGFTPILQYVDEAEWHDRSFVVQGKHSIKIGKQTNADTSIVVNRYEIDPETRYVFPSSDTELFLNDFKYGLGTGVTLEEKIDTKISESFHLIGGIEVSEFDILPKSTVPGRADRNGNIVAQAGTLKYYTRANDPSSLVEIARATDLSYQNYGLYLEGHYRVTEDLKLILGARYDSNSRFDTRPFSPRAAAIYSNDETNLTFKYIFSRAFVAPAPYFGYNVFDNGTALNISNPDLEPERAISNEFNVTWAKDRAIVGGSFYYNRQSNLILVGDLALPANTLADEVYTDVGGTSKRRLTNSVNGGESTSTGFDLYTRYTGVTVSPWASLSYVDYESDTGFGKTGLAKTSRINVRAGVSYHILPNLSLTPSLNYRTTPVGIQDTFGLRDELRNPYEINAHLLYSPTTDLDLFVDLRNITNNRYALRGILGPVPQETFVAHAGARYKF